MINKDGILIQKLYSGTSFDPLGLTQAKQPKFDPSAKIKLEIFFGGLEAQKSIKHNYKLRIRNFNQVTKRYYTANIEPGYILMQKTTYLMEHYTGDSTGTKHSKLFKDFTGKSIQELEREGTFYFGLGFSYQ